jgi:hypothetical protein
MAAHCSTVIIAPHIHLHWQMADTDIDNDYAEIEICCHGCGQSTLIKYNLPDENIIPDNGVACLARFKKRFLALHADCANEADPTACPPERTHVNVIDVTHMNVLEVEDLPKN